MERRRRRRRRTEKGRRREEEEGGTWRPDVAAVAEGRLCVALQDRSECRKKPHIRQTDRQADRQLGSFQTRGTSGKSESVLVSPAELILFVPAQDEQLLRAFVFSFLKKNPTPNI